MKDGQFATITCEIEYAPDGALPEEDRPLKNVIAATVEGALDGHPDLTVYGRVKVDLT